MWIYLNDAALSVVKERGQDSALRVRSRIRGDIEKVFGSDTVVVEDPYADYRFRTVLPATVVGMVVMKSILGIDYDNFKGSVTDRDREAAYFAVWNAFRTHAEDMEEEEVAL